MAEMLALDVSVCLCSYSPSIFARLWLHLLASSGDRICREGFVSEEPVCSVLTYPSFDVHHLSGAYLTLSRTTMSSECNDCSAENTCTCALCVVCFQGVK